MHWASIAFDWNQARAFLAVAEEGSLSAAAKALRVTQPTITRQLAALENTLGVVLVERTGRTVVLTTAGLDLLDHVRAMAVGASAMSLAATGQAQAVDGLVRITASEMTAAYLLPPLLDRVRDVAPDLEVEILADNSVRDLLQREADIAVRHVRPEQANTITKRVAEDPMRFYATPAYLDQFGEPTLGQGHSHHQFVSFGDFERVVGYLSRVGLNLGRRNFRNTSNSQLVEWEIARNGHAIAIMTDRIANRFPAFRPVLSEIAPFSMPVWLVAHRELQTSRRIRLVFDLLAKGLAGKAAPPAIP